MTYDADNARIVLKTSGREYVGEGKTVNDAFSAINLSWEQIKAKGMVKVFKGKLSYEHLFYFGQLRRIFTNKITMAMWAKRLELLLGETNKK